MYLDQPSRFPLPKGAPESRNPVLQGAPAFQFPYSVIDTLNKILEVAFSGFPENVSPLLRI